ncbi:hypothetical protein [Flavobacterium columnare]|nr:hypothetical protein [Flavobacterium columnare]
MKKLTEFETMKLLFNNVFRVLPITHKYTQLSDDYKEQQTKLG